MKRLLAALLLALMLPAGGAAAQSTCKYITTGAVLTAGQWNFCFSSKQDVLGFTALNKAGDTMTGKLTTFAASSGGAGFNVFPGSAPSAPVNGDLWVTSAGLFARVNGGTVGPFVDSSNSPVASVFGRTGAVAAAANDYSFSQISGSVAATQLPNPSATTLGGVKSLAAVSHNFLTSIGTNGTPTQAQPAVADLSDVKTGTGSVVLATTPTLVTPILGVATATSVNKLAITAPATGSTLAVADGKTLTASNTLTLTGTDGSSVAFGSGGTVGTVGYATVGQIPGTATNDNASAGKVGEYVSSTIASGSAVALTNATAAAITNISLTAGDWDVSFIVSFNGGASTTVNYMIGSMSTVSSTSINTTPGFVASQTAPGSVLFNNANVTFTVGPVRLSLAGTTTLFAAVQAGFGTSTANSFGLLQARRAR